MTNFEQENARTDYLLARISDRTQFIEHLSAKAYKLNKTDFVLGRLLLKVQQISTI
jgi:hypothetical protein